jgi:[acyl-carrier-protein] S-malonyltransferase
MLSDFAENDIVQATFKEASDAIGYDMWQLISEDADGKLNQTDYTQPALLTASVAMYRLIQATRAVTPKAVAGHSLGEYSALVCSGVISLADAVVLVKKRGEFMQTSVPAGVGAMYAIIGLADEQIIQACADAAQGEVVSAVNFNSPGQVVIAGHKAAVERAGELCKAAGAKRALPLPVSVPSHCALMKDAAEQLALELDKITFNTPTIDVINNVDVAIENSAEAIKTALVKQLYSPVRWTETVEALAQAGVENLIETGPGKVLQGLIKRIDKSLVCVAANSTATVEQAIELVK